MFKRLKAGRASGLPLVLIERRLTMKRLILILIACVFLMGACATSNEGPPPVMYPDPETNPQDYNPGY